MHVTKRQGHVLQKFLAELLYSDMTLTSSVVAAIGIFALSLSQTRITATTPISILHKVV